jgi:hypothetical protein
MLSFRVETVRFWRWVDLSQYRLQWRILVVAVFSLPPELAENRWSVSTIAPHFLFPALLKFQPYIWVTEPTHRRCDGGMDVAIM